MAAWNAEGYDEMAELTAGDVDALEVEAAKDDVTDGGDVVRFEVSLTGTVPTPDEDADQEARTGARYSIVYESTAAADPITLEGSLPLVYDPERQSWSVEWDPSLLLPGIEGATRLAVRARWLERGPIFDAKGRELARGTAEDRFYPHGSLAGSVVGHLEPLARRRARLLGHKKGELAGASGLEFAYEERLAGRPATTLVVHDASGRTIERVGRRKGRDGRAVRSTIDIDVQRAAASAFGKTVGGAVVMDPRTGAILAAVSSSEIDPNNYVGAEDVRPFNRALSGVYPPGSSLKVMTAAVALDTGEFKPSSTLTGPPEYKGVRNFESGSFGTIDFATALKHSVNTAFAQVAEELGAKILFRYANRFGFNKPPRLHVSAANSSFPLPADPGDLMWGAIGQAQVLATPLQMASIAATIANDGSRIEPKASTHERGSEVRVVSKKTADTLTEMMIGVVEGGTGTAARISGADVAGKTGTAEALLEGKIENHAWFIAFAPASDPRVAIAVVSEFGGVGGRVAAPLARSILVNVLPLVK